MHTSPQPVVPTAPTRSVSGPRTSSPRRRKGLRPVRLFAALGIVVVPAAGVFATTAIDPVATDTQLMLAGGFITFGFGSLVALITTRHAVSVAPPVHRTPAF